MLGSWNRLILITEGPSDKALLDLLEPHKVRLLNHIVFAYGEHKADRMTGWIEKNWTPEKLKNLKVAIEDQLTDRKISEILAAAIKDITFEKEKTTDAQGKTVYKDKKKKLDARDDVFKRPAGSGSKDLKKARGFFSKEKMDPEDHAAKQAAVDAVAQSRPDRSGEKANMDDPKKHLGIKQMHINKQDSLDGGKEQTVGQRISQLQKFLEKDPDHALASKWKRAIDNLSARDESEVLAGSAGSRSDTGERLRGMRLSYHQMINMNNRLANKWKENTKRMKELVGSKDKLNREKDRLNALRHEIKNTGRIVKAQLARNPGNEALAKKLEDLAAEFKAATKEIEDNAASFKEIADRVSEISQWEKRAKKDMEELADLIKASRKDISGTAQTNVSAEKQKQEVVDSMLKDYPPDHPAVINKAKKLNVPPPLERQKISVDKKTGEEKITYSVWDAKKIATWRLNPNNFDAGTYDLPDDSEKFNDPKYPQVPGTTPGSSKFKNPKSSPDEAEREAEPEIVKPKMKVPRGMSNEDTQKLSNLQREYGAAKNSGASKKDLAGIKLKIDKLIIPAVPEEPWKQGQVTKRPGANEVEVVRPGRYDGERWSRSAPSEEKTTARADNVTGQMQRMKVNVKKQVDLVWSQKAWDWLPDVESDSVRAAKAGAERGGEKDVEKPEGSRRDWAGGGQNLKPGMRPVSNSAQQQRQDQMLDVPEKPTITPGRVKDVVGTAIKKASDTRKDAEEPDTGIFPGPKDIGDKAKNLSGISGEYDPKDGSFSVGKPSLGAKKPAFSVDPLKRKKKEED